MDYRLIVLTHGDSAPLNNTLSSFGKHVHPHPKEAVLVYDGLTLYGAGTPAPNVGAVRADWRFLTTGVAGGVGFCEATQTAWREARSDGPDWVFWLEHDFEFNRDVDLTQLAAVMDEEPQVTQMALYRNPVNQEEIEHGGFLKIPSRVNDFTYRRTPMMTWEPGDQQAVPIEAEWIEHRSFWTTNPSLFRRSMTRLVWPEGPHCEGHFGFAVKAAIHGGTFGMWGDGTEWVRHTGVRTGKGY